VYMYSIMYYIVARCVAQPGEEVTYITQASSHSTPMASPLASPFLLAPDR